MVNTQKTRIIANQELREQLRRLGVNISLLEQYGLKDEAMLDLLTGLKGLKAYYDKRV